MASSKTSKLKIKTTKKRRARKPPRASNPLGGWRVAPVADDDQTDQVLSKFGTNFDDQFKFLRDARRQLLAYAARLRGDHTQVVRGNLVGDSVRETHGLLVRVAAQLESRARQVVEDEDRHDQWIHLMNM